MTAVTAAPMPLRTCATCRHWCPPAPASDPVEPAVYGQCRRHAPTLADTWPPVRGDQWCGDHQTDSRYHGRSVTVSGGFGVIDHQGLMP